MSKNVQKAVRAALSRLRKLSAVCLLAVMTAAAVLITSPVFADTWVDDSAWLFDEDTCRRLEEACEDYGDRIGADLVIATLDWNTGQQGTDYARSYLLDNGFGRGEGREGILFLIDMYQREYTVYEYNTEAEGYLLTDYEGDRILDALESPMRSGDYGEAAMRFLEQCVYYAGVDVGGNYESSSGVHAKPAGINWLICAVVAVTCSLVITCILVALRNKDQKPAAGVYMKDGRLEIRVHEDVFINTTVTKRKIETSSGGGGGGFSGGGRGGGHGGSRKF